jgi:DNA-binding transcriptional LysR family regulator
VLRKAGVPAARVFESRKQAVVYFTGSGLSGRLRFGVTDDLALTPVPRILRDFRQLYPRIDLELTVSQSGALQRRVESGHLDVAFIKQAAGQ